MQLETVAQLTSLVAEGRTLSYSHDAQMVTAWQTRFEVAVGCTMENEAESQVVRDEHMRSDVVDGA